MPTARPMRVSSDRLVGGLLAILACGVAAAQEARAQEAGVQDAAAREEGARDAAARDAGGEDRLRCINLSSIDRTEVIDDQTIAFHLTRGRVYLNRLARACRNLARNRPFAYETSTGQLCAIDTITVIEDFGLGVNYGDTCGLGDFVLTDEEEIEVLKGEREPVEVEAEEVEVEAEVEPRGAGADPVMDGAHEAVARDSRSYARCLREGDVDCIDVFMHWELHGQLTGRNQNTLRRTIVNGGPGLMTSRESTLNMVSQYRGTVRMLDPANPGEPFAVGERLFSIVPYRTHRLEGAGVLYEQSSYMLGVSEDAGKSWRFVNGSGFEPGEIESIVPGFSEMPVPATEDNVIVAPRRERSRYLRTLDAGFDFVEGAAVYELSLEVRRVLDGVIDLLVAFDDPSHPSKPRLGRTRLEPGQESLEIRSQMLTGFERGKIYEVVIYGSEPVTATELFEHRQSMLFVPTEAQYELMMGEAVR